MDPKKFRTLYTAEVDAAETQSRAAGNASVAPRSPAELAGRIADRAAAVDDRLAAINEGAADAVEHPNLMDALIEVLADPNDLDQVRLTALTTLQQNTFRSAEFQPYQADFTAALRVAATDDDKELRERALDLLALNGDPYVQQLLIDGLLDPKKALVTPGLALRMIGYDVHAEYYPLLRDIVETSKKPKLRQAALKLLAADSGAKDLFARIAADPGEDATARSTSALALQAIAPEEFSSMAPALVADEGTDDKVRTSVLTALAHGPAENPAEMTTVARDIETSSTANAPLKTAARRFLRVADNAG